MKLSVISPTLNEAGNLSRLVEELERALVGIDYEILIVDDNSPDLTWSIAQQMCATHPRLRTIRRMQDRGLSLAVIAGFSAAEGDVVACIDADLQHDPAILATMFNELLQGTDVVVGSRHVTGGSTGEWSRWRRFESWIATKIAQLLLGFRLKDPMSGYFMVRRQDFSRIQNALNGQGFKILLEVLAKLPDAKIKEVPYTFRPRTQGISKLSSRVIWQYVHQVWRLCSSSQRLFVRFMKPVVVGSIGVFFNLGVMALLLKLTKLHNWRASAIASLAASVQNYVLFSIWTSTDGVAKAYRTQPRYLRYLLGSAPGLVIATIFYAGLTWRLGRTSISGDGASAIFYARLACQFAAVSCGVWTNSALNKVIARPELVPLEGEAHTALPETIKALATEAGK